jgi:hypothetical protein
MRSERQNIASRANGAKSRGPVTPEGRLASAGNRLDHGMLADAIVIEGEAADRLAALSEAFHRQLQPRDEVELAYVENMIMCRWRQIRLWELESANMGYEIRKQAHAHESETKRTRAALAFRSLSDESRSLELMNRYETRFARQFIRSHQCLLNLRANREPDSSPPPPSPKAPIPRPEPTECILPLEPKPDEPCSKQELYPKPETHAMLDFSGRGAVAMTARQVPAITGGASEGVSRRNRSGGSVAVGWGRELNLRHCHSAIRMERYRDSEHSFRSHSPQAHCADVPLVIWSVTLSQVLYLQCRISFPKNCAHGKSAGWLERVTDLFIPARPVALLVTGSRRSAGDLVAGGVY